MLSVYFSEAKKVVFRLKITEILALIRQPNMFHHIQWISENPNHKVILNVTPIRIPKITARVVTFLDKIPTRNAAKIGP